MTNNQIAIEIGKLAGRSFELKKTEQGHMMIACPKCNTHRLEIWDCGYSSFNCGGIKCKCGYELDLGCCLGWEPTEFIRKEWNSHCKTSLPDYLNDRDAIIAVIEKQPKTIKETLVAKLRENVCSSKHVEGWTTDDIVDILVATAKQLCVALLKAKNLWKEPNTNKNETSND